MYSCIMGTLVKLKSSVRLDLLILMLISEHERVCEGRNLTIMTYSTASIS